MIIFNSKAYATNFVTFDNVIVEIFANCSLEEYLGKLERGEDVSGVVAKIYQTDAIDEMSIDYRERPSDEAFIQEVYDNASNMDVLSRIATCKDFCGAYGLDSEVNDFTRSVTVKALRERRDEYRMSMSDPENNPKILNFFGAAMVGGQGNVEVPYDADIVKGQVKDALGIMPDDDRADLPIAQRQKEALAHRRLMWEVEQYQENYHPYWIQLPSYEEAEFFESLSTYEKKVVCDSLIQPHFSLTFLREFKAAYPEKPITEELLVTLESYIMLSLNRNNPFSKDGLKQFFVDFIDSRELTIQDPDIARADSAFKAAFRGRPPRILNELLAAYRRYTGKDASSESLSDEDIDKLVKMFKVPSVSKVAKLGNINLIALALVCDLSTVKKDHLDLLKAYLSSEKFYNGQITVTRRDGTNRYSESVPVYDNLKQFCEWYEKTGKQCNTKDLATVLEVFRQVRPRDFKSDMSAVDIYDFVRLKLARTDKEKYERDYNYSFSDNEVAIRGRDIEVYAGRYKMYMLKPDDLRNYIVGYETSCCQHYGNAGAACVWKYTTDPFAACVIIEDINTKDILAQSFVWTDEKKDTFVFDNIEFANDTGNTCNNYTGIIAKYVSALPYDNVHMGTGYTNGVYNQWGNQVSSRELAIMPHTTDPNNRHVYSDYHGPSHGGSIARVFKKKGNVLITGGYGKVEVKGQNGNREVPFPETHYDQFLGPNNPLRYFLTTNYTLEEMTEKVNELRNNPSDELIDEFVRANPQVIGEGMFDHVPADTQRWLITDHFDVLDTIPDPIPEVVQAILERNPSKLGDMYRTGHITTENINQCLERDGRLICLLPEITYEFAQTAVASNGYAIELIPQDIVDDELILQAVSSTPDAISLVPFADEHIKEAAVRADPNVIALIENPSEELQVLAASLYPASLLGVDNPCFNAVKMAVIGDPENGITGNWHLIRNFVKGNEEFALSVAREHEDEITNILSPRVMDRISL